MMSVLEQHQFIQEEQSSDTRTTYNHLQAGPPEPAIDTASLPVQP